MMASTAACCSATGDRAAEEAACETLLPEKDVDGITPGSLAGVVCGRGERLSPPCTAQACMEVLDYYGCDPAGRRAAVIGRSLVIGRPVSMLLQRRNATVTMCHSRMADLPAVCRQAEILVAAAGQSGIGGRRLLAPGQVVLDVGINVGPEGGLQEMWTSRAPSDRGGCYTRARRGWGRHHRGPGQACGGGRGKDAVMRALKLFVSSVLGGACIGLGALPTCLWRTGWQGALFFTVGLFTICTFGFHLFTGKVCYVFQKGGPTRGTCPSSGWGNLAGTGAVAAAVRLTRLAPLAEKAAGLCRVKLEDSLPSVFLLAVLCNVFIYIAVEGFRSNPHEIGKYLSLFFGVMGFVLCEFEHCVANMFYISTAGLWSGRAAGYLLVMTLGKQRRRHMDPPFAQAFLRRPDRSE